MSRLSLYLLFLVFLTTPARCGKVIFEDCGSTYDLQEVHISDCQRIVPCYLTVGVSANVSIVYKAGYTSKSLLQNVYISLNSVQTPAKVTPTACEATWCPVNTTTSSQYEAVLDLPSPIALNTRGNLIWMIYNEYGVSVLCFNVVIQTRKITRPAPFEILQDNEELDPRLIY